MYSRLRESAQRFAVFEGHVHDGIALGYARFSVEGVAFRERT
jgi:hypothetical protein